MGELYDRLNRNCRNLAMITKVAKCAKDEDVRAEARHSALVYTLLIGALCDEMGEEIYTVGLKNVR